MNQDIKQLKKENELLLNEVHHRVKNNFQVIISLIQMLADQHQEASSIFIDLINRIRSMSLTYENILIGESVAYVDFNKYVKSLIENIETSCGCAKIHLHIDQKIKLSLEKVNPLGIAINEIIVNACRHGFSEKNSHNKIDVIIKKQDNDISIVINDNGVGIDDEYLDKTPNTLGLNLSRMLIAEQLDGKFLVKKENGTSVLITFKDKSSILS